MMEQALDLSHVVECGWAEARVQISSYCNGATGQHVGYQAELWLDVREGDDIVLTMRAALAPNDLEALWESVNRVNRDVHTLERLSYLSGDAREALLEAIKTNKEKEATYE